MEELNEWDIVAHKMQAAVVRIWASLIKTISVKFCTDKGKELGAPIILNMDEMALYFQEAEINRMDPEAGFITRQTAIAKWDSSPVQALQLWNDEVINQLRIKLVSIGDSEESKPYRGLLGKLESLNVKMKKYPQVILLCNGAKNGPCFRICDEDVGGKQYVICFTDDYKNRAFWWPEKESRYTQQGRFQCMGKNVLFSFNS